LNGEDRRFAAFEEIGEDGRFAAFGKSGENCEVRMAENGFFGGFRLTSGGKTLHY